jgi:hypothetical protein
MRYGRINEDEQDFLGDMDALLTTEIAIEAKTETKVEVAEEEEEAILIPLDYHIFSTSNNEPTGKKEPVDTYYCDKVRGIVPIGKAKIKANLLKQAFKNKTYFVEETATKVFESGKVVTVKTIVYKTK